MPDDKKKPFAPTPKQAEAPKKGPPAAAPATNKPATNKPGDKKTIR
jgi:hypothetical protein